MAHGTGRRARAGDTESDTSRIYHMAWPQRRRVYCDRVRVLLNTVPISSNRVHILRVCVCITPR